jgi:transcriptional regulator with XRE-family HTH domain
MLTADPVELTVGQRIRAIREARGLSLRALAGLSGLSPNAISLIERGENSATVGSLHALATALGVTLSDFFREDQSNTLVITRTSGRIRTEVGSLVLESLASGLGEQQLEPFLMTLEPGAGVEEPVSHRGEEFVHLLVGELDYWVDGRHLVLSPGDSLLFKAGMPHHFMNRGATTSQLLIVFMAGAGSHLAAASAKGE